MQFPRRGVFIQMDSLDFTILFNSSLTLSGSVAPRCALGIVFDKRTRSIDAESQREIAIAGGTIRGREKGNDCAQPIFAGPIPCCAVFAREWKGTGRNRFADGRVGGRNDLYAVAVAV